MALRPDREPAYIDTTFFMNETGEAGLVVVYDTSASGVGTALDDANAKVKLPDNGNGSGEVPAGILVGDVVNKDLTRTHLNAHKRESQVGGKVGVRRDGHITTNMIETGVTPTVGDSAYFTLNGRINTTSTNSTKIGTFLTAKDSDGYAKIDINIH